MIESLQLIYAKASKNKGSVIKWIEWASISKYLAINIQSPSLRTCRALQKITEQQISFDWLASLLDYHFYLGTWKKRISKRELGARRNPSSEQTPSLHVCCRQVPLRRGDKTYKVEHQTSVL